MENTTLYILGSNHKYEIRRWEDILKYYNADYKLVKKYTIRRGEYEWFYNLVCHMPNWQLELVRRDIKELERPATYRRPNKYGSLYLREIL